MSVCVLPNVLFYVFGPSEILHAIIRIPNSLAQHTQNSAFSRVWMMSVHNYDALCICLNEIFSHWNSYKHFLTWRFSLNLTNERSCYGCFGRKTKHSTQNYVFEFRSFVFLLLMLSVTVAAFIIFYVLVSFQSSQNNKYFDSLFFVINMCVCVCLWLTGAAFVPLT